MVIMDTKRILEMIKQSFYENWEPHKLAIKIAQEQKENDATIAEELGSPEIAESIRNS